MRMGTRARARMPAAWRMATAALLSTTAPRLAAACPVCFGENDSALAAGINDGIFVMLGLIVLLWGAFGSFFLYLRRRARIAAAAEAAAAPDGNACRQAAALHVPHAQGGTL